MNEFIKIFSENEKLQILIILFFLTFLVFVMTKTLKQLMYTTFTLKSDNVNKRKDKFFKTLFEGLKIGTIKSIEDVVNIYKGISGLSSEDLSYRYGLSKSLREFLVELISRNLDKEINDDDIIQIKEKISAYLKSNEETSPYSDLPTAERNALYDLTEYLEKDNKEASKRKVLEISAMIQARNDDLIKIKNINKWTVPLSIVGLVLTVIFGVIALIV